MREIWRILASRLSFMPGTRPLFVGMAETALALAAGIFRECGISGAIFLADTRHEFPVPRLVEFVESHSHAMGHCLYRPANVDLRECQVHLIGIDDELTTGDTLRHLYEGLLNAGIDIRAFTKVALTDWSGGENVISLLSGRWRWFPEGIPQSLPKSSYPAQKNISISSRQDWGRFGSQDVSGIPWPHIHASPGEKILVLGSGEFVWPPFLLAERLEAEGASALFGATTRSPIMKGMAIREKLEFPDNYGQGIANYLYNVNARDFDSIFLCVETGASSVPKELLEALPGVKILEY